MAKTHRCRASAAATGAGFLARSLATEDELRKTPAVQQQRTEKGAVIMIRITQVTVNPPLDDTLFLKPDFAK